jgi:hypothetical protein
MKISGGKCAFALALVMAAGSVAGSEERKSVSIISPVAGWISNETTFTIPGNPVPQTLKEDGMLYGVYMMYADQDISFGCLGHYSGLENTRENSYMAFAYYHLPVDWAVRPMFGMALDYLRFSTEMPQKDVAPLQSMDIDTSIWAYHPIAGATIGGDALNITPFAGYFKEQVRVLVNSPGMKMGPAIKYGFRTEVSEALEYGSLGTMLKAKYSHFLAFDGKIYFRMRDGAYPLMTVRSRVDIFLARNLGISVKADYLKDKSEKNFFVMAGPDFVF